MPSSPVELAAGAAGPEDLADVAEDDPLALGAALRSSEQRVIAAALRAAPSRLEAARAVGISPRTLRYKLAQLRAQGVSLHSREGR